MEPFKNPLDGVPKRPPQPDEDADERALIRSRLMAFAAREGLGASRLTELIYKTTRSPVSQSTVQRFVADKHRTRDKGFETIRRFVLMLSANEAFGLLGQTLSDYFPDSRDAGHARGDDRQIEGSWSVCAANPVNGRSVKAYSALRLHQPPDASFLIVREDVTDRLMWGTGRTIMCNAEGVALRRSDGIYCVMREAVTFTERFYWLRRADGGTHYTGLLLDRVLKAKPRNNENEYFRLDVTLTREEPPPVRQGGTGEVSP